MPTVQSDHRSRAVFTVFEINNHGFPSSFPADLLHFTYPPVPTPNTPVSAPLEAHQENHVWLVSAIGFLKDVRALLVCHFTGIGQE